MITVLADHNIEGQAALLWSTIATSGWLELNLLGLATFAEIGLPLISTDRAVWQFVQTHDMLLLTGNRNMDGEESLDSRHCHSRLFCFLPLCLRSSSLLS